MKKAVIRAALLTAVCAQFAVSAYSATPPQSSTPSQMQMPADARGAFSPSAPVNLTYRIDSGAEGEPLRVDVTITTRLTAGMLLVEVAKQQGAQALGDTLKRLDLSQASRPLILQLQAIPLGAGEHFLVLLLTIDTEAGPMSRSFRIDLVPAPGGDIL